MDERVIQFRVGVVVLSAGLITGILIFIFGEGWTPRYTVYADYLSAPGVKVGTPVRKNGILIGRVSDVELKEQGVRLTLKVDQDIKLYSSETCMVATTGLIGDPIVTFLPGEDGNRGEVITKGNLIPNTAVQPDPIAAATKSLGDAMNIVTDLQGSFESTMENIGQTSDTIREAGDNIAQITDKINQSLGDEEGSLESFFADIRRLTQSAEMAVASFDSVMRNVNDILGDERFKGDLTDALAALPMMIQEAELTLEEAKESMQSFRLASDSARVNLDNLQGVTGPMKENGAQMMTDIQRSIRSVSSMADQLEQFTRSLNESEGTVGLLLNDPELYYEFLSAVRNIEDLTASFRPVARDLRVAADKIARDPGQLGLRGAFNRTPAGAGFKGGLLGGNSDWTR